MIDIVTTLQRAGLSEKEALCYFALCKLGEATAYKVALVARLKKPIVYVTLDALRKAGLVLVTPHPKKTLYRPKDPHVLLDRAESNAKALASIIPTLRNVTEGRETSPIFYFDGKDMYRDALFHRIDQLHDCEILTYFGKSSTLLTKIPQVYHDYNRTLHAQNIRVRAFAPRDASLSLFREFDTRYSIVVRELPPEKYDSSVTFEITPLFVRILMYREKRAVILEDPLLVQSQKAIFNLLWDTQPSVS